MKTILIAIVFVMSMTAQSCGQDKKEVFILPRNFTGYIVILYNQSTGSPIRLEDGKRIYEIPQNGVLITKSSDNPDWMELPEFYYEKIEKISQISFKVDYKDLPADSIVAYGGISGTANKDLTGKEVVRFTKYFVGNKSQIDTAYQKAEKLDMLKLVN